MSEKAKPILEIDLHENGGQVIFRSLNEVEEWITNEENYWQWVKTEIGNWNTKAGPGGFGNIWGHLTGDLTQLKNTLKAAKSKSMDNLASNFEVLKGFYLRIYVEGNGIFSKSAKARYIENLKEKDPVAAIFTLGYFINYPFTNNPNYIKGIALGTLFEQGIKGHSAHKDSIKALNSEWMDHLNQAKDNFVENQNEFNKFKKVFSDFFNSQNEIFNDNINQFKSQLEDLTSTYDKKLSLQAPVKYWKKKSTNHRRLAILFGILSLAGMPFLLYVLGEEALSVIGKLKPGENPTYWHLFILIITGILGVWILKVLIKIFLSHTHLNIDAEERITLTETYLSLLREGHGLNEGDKQLILQNLFKSTPTGIVQDDSMPSNTIDMLMRLFKK